LYYMETELSGKALILLVASTAITKQTSWLQETIIRLHIRVRVFYFPPILWLFENICVIWSILWYSMETVLSVEASTSLVASSTITIQTSWLQGTIIRLHIGDMIVYYQMSQFVYI
jgi:hypothetical protein